MFHNSQNDEYLELCIRRIKDEKNHVWVEQFLDIVGDRKNPEKIKLNDIGCNLGQFYKGLKTRYAQKLMLFFGRIRNGNGKVIQYYFTR